MLTYRKNDFEGWSQEKIKKWILTNKRHLVGSAVFTCSDTKTSKLIVKVTKNQCEDSFKPSHIGSLVLLGGSVYIFDMLPPKATITKFESFLLDANVDYLIALRDFELDTEKFSKDIILHVNKLYGFISAIQSAFKCFYYPFREHCSEVHLAELNKQGLFTRYKPNDTTPANLLEILLRGER